MNESSKNFTFRHQLKTSVIDENNDAIHGYYIADLLKHRSLSAEDMLFLLFKGDLPTAYEKELISTLYKIALYISPRSEPIQAGFSAACSGTYPKHLLPIMINVANGNIASDLQNIIKHYRRLIHENIAADLTTDGFEKVDYCSDKTLQDIAFLVSGLHKESMAIQWVCKQRTLPNFNAFIIAGIIDLGIIPKYSVLFYQTLVAPSLAAQSCDFIGRTIKDYFFESDEDYFFEDIKDD